MWVCRRDMVEGASHTQGCCEIVGVFVHGDVQGRREEEEGGASMRNWTLYQGMEAGYFA